MIEDRIYLFIYLVYISCLGDKNVRCSWDFSDLRVYGLEHQECTVWNTKGVRFGTGVQFGTPKVYGLEHHECTVWNTKGVRFRTLKACDLEHQECTIWNTKGVRFRTPILLIKTPEYFLWNRIEFRCEVICTFKMIYNSKYRIA